MLFDVVGRRRTSHEDGLQYGRGAPWNFDNPDGDSGPFGGNSLRMCRPPASGRAPDSSSPPAGPIAG
ncbi:MAG: hypothetical protein ACLPXZ_27335 [Mycobacterium sp.]